MQNTLKEQAVLMSDKQRILRFSFPIVIVSLAFFLNVYERLLSIYELAKNPGTSYLMSNSQSFLYVVIYIACVAGLIIFPKLLQDNELLSMNWKAASMGCIISIFGGFYSDIFWLFKKAIISNSPQLFTSGLLLYLSQEYWFYISLFVFILFLAYVKLFWVENKKEIKNSRHAEIIILLLAIFIPLLIVVPLPIMNIALLHSTSSTYFNEMPISILFFKNSLYGVGEVLLLFIAYRYRTYLKIPNKNLIHLLNIIGIGCIIVLFLEVYWTIYPYKILSLRMGFPAGQILAMGGENLKENALQFLPILFLLAVAGLMRQFIKKKRFDVESASETSGNFGTASWANQKGLENLNVYNEQNGLPIGTDNQGKVLYLPLMNKLTIAPPGGWKTTASSMLALLKYKGPMFVLDVKGELWATTARYRSEVLGRYVVKIDPFGVTQGKDFVRGKSAELLKKFQLNPFDWIPEDRGARDRMINAFAASFVINEGGYTTHFDDNAKILIRGFIDYMMAMPKAERNLAALYHLMSENVEQAELTFNQMANLEGRAGAAANQIKRVGTDERGSILSTSYRQIDWMSDSNIQETLALSNFDLRDILKGNIDIFVILPVYHVKEHSRLFRMIMSLIMSLIVQAEPSDLPKQKMLFLLEELAQMGYTPDVEQCIEVLRDRGVVVWTVFQTLSQIEMFEKPDLFKGAPLKQIFTNDDDKTMKWIQTLGGHKTVLTKTLSTNTGDSRQKMQLFNGSVSKGEGESIHETGVDLIQLNEIRELPINEQFVFLHGTKPIRCKKVRYFEHEIFSGIYDQNPLEVRD